MQRVLNDDTSSLVLIIRLHKLLHNKLVLHAHNVLVNDEDLLLQKAFMNLYLSYVQIAIKADDIFDPKLV